MPTQMRQQPRAVPTAEHMRRRRLIAVTVAVVLVLDGVAPVLGTLHAQAAQLLLFGLALFVTGADLVAPAGQCLRLSHATPVNSSHLLTRRRQRLRIPGVLVQQLGPALQR